MEPSSPYRPRISRETRHLLTAGVLAVATLWILARFRFRDLPPTPNPLPAVLGQLTTGPTYDDLADEIAKLQSRLEGRLLSLEPSPITLGSPRPAHRLTALRVRDDLALTLDPIGTTFEEARDVLSRDRASGLALVRVPADIVSPPLVPWRPRRLQQPHYLVATDSSPSGISLRPAFIGSLNPMESSLWSDPLWVAPAQSDLALGSFLFSSGAELVGMVIAYGAEPAIVPGSTLLAEVDRLVTRSSTDAGSLGIEVQPLTEPVASVTGATAGVVVTWVQRESPAASHLMVGDVIEAVDGRMIDTRQQWDVLAGRLSAGETLMLRVRTRGKTKDVPLVAGTRAAQPVSGSLGLVLLRRTGIGVEIARVDVASAGERAGLAVGDTITQIGSLPAPTPAQIMRAFRALPRGQRVLIAVTRGDTHRVMTLER